MTSLIHGHHPFSNECLKNKREHSLRKAATSLGPVRLGRPDDSDDCNVKERKLQDAVTLSYNREANKAIQSRFTGVLKFPGSLPHTLHGLRDISEAYLIGCHPTSLS